MSPRGRWRWLLWDAPRIAAGRALGYLRSHGLRAFAARAARELRAAGLPDLDAQYQRWLESGGDAAAAPDAAAIAALARAPRFLIVAWAPPDDLETSVLLRSLRAQPYPHWRAVPAAGAAAANEAVAASDATHVTFLDPGDHVDREALARLADRVLRDDPAILYGDEDQESPDGRRLAPRFKPDWSPELLLSYHYFGHATVYDCARFAKLGGLREHAAGSLEYDLALRATEADTRVAHVPHVLTHRPARGCSFEPVLGSQEGAQGAEAMLLEAMERRGVPARVESTRLPGSYRVRPLLDATRRVSILVPTRDRVDLLRRCISSIERFTPGDRWELIVVDNGSREPKILEYLKSLRHRVLTDEGPFNFSRLMNGAAREATGDALLFLNNDTEVREGWAQALLEALALPGVGVAGATLLYPGGSIQHAGLLLGVGVVAGGSHKGRDPAEAGYLGSLQVMRNYSAVTAACMGVQREAFESAGGFDEALASSFQDVDLCLRLARIGWRTVYTPWCVAVHHETASRPRKLDAAEIRLMRERWGAALANDPCYHPLLTRERESFEMARS